jgi:hypothetical protein
MLNTLPPRSTRQDWMLGACRQREVLRRMHLAQAKVAHQRQAESAFLILLT